MLPNFINHPALKKYLFIWIGIIAIATFLAVSISIGKIYLIILLGIIVSYLIHPIYLLFLIIYLNPFADWIVVKFPSLFTKLIIDLLIFVFASSILARNLIKKKKWIGSPFWKWLLPLFTFFIISALFHGTTFEDVIFINWLHFRFVYLAIAITQLKISDTKYAALIKGLFIIFFVQLGIGLFQVLGGEWAKGAFYQDSDRVALSYGRLQYSSYETAMHFNLSGITYIYSTFYLPGLLGSFLLIMLCLASGMRNAISRIPLYGNQLRSNVGRLPFYSFFSKRKWYLLGFSLTTGLMLLTFNRTTYISLFVLLSFLFLRSINKEKKILLYAVTILGCSILIYGWEMLFDYLMRVNNPDIGELDIIARFLSFYSTYLSQETPRKIAYFVILPNVLLEKPFWGLGIASVLDQEKFFLDSIMLSQALFYAYADAGIVRLFVDYGVLGAVFWGLLFIYIFSHARKGYIHSANSKEKAICFSVMAGVITLLPESIGTTLILAKSYGLYLWILIGFSQKWRQPSAVSFAANGHFIKAG